MKTYLVSRAWKERRNTIWHLMNRSKPGPHYTDPGGLFAGYAARLSSRRARWLVRLRSRGFPFQ